MLVGERAAGHVRDRLARVYGAVWRCTLFFVVFGCASAALILPAAPHLAAMKARGGDPQIFYDAVGLAAILLATVIMVRFIDRRPVSAVGLGTRHVPRDMGLGLALGTAWLCVGLMAALATGWAHLQSVTFSAPLLLFAAAAAVCNVLTQQLLLCGYVFNAIETRSNFTTALMVAATLFVGYHFGAYRGALLPAVNVFCAATLFCIAYGVSRSIWFPMGIHFAWNFLLGPVLGLTVSGNTGLAVARPLVTLDGPRLFTGGAFGFEGGLIVTAVTALMCVALAAASRRRTCRSAAGIAPAPIRVGAEPAPPASLPE